MILTLASRNVDKNQILKWCVMILVLKSWFHVEDMISHKRKIWKVSVAKQKNIGVSAIFRVKTNRRYDIL